MISDDVELDRAYAQASFPKDIYGFLKNQELASSLTDHAAGFLLQIYCDHTYGEILTTRDAPRYDFVERINETDYNSVYKVRDNETDCLYVLKIANPQHREEAKKLLNNERTKYEAVTSPHVVKCHSFNYTRKDGRDFLFYLVLNLVEGTDLSQTLKTQAGSKWEYPRAAALARDIARGLADLHSRCIVHRDVKPANIVVSPDGRATLVDLGIAADVTRAPDPAGTEGYLSPEQSQGNDALLPSDVFSFGLVLWEVLVGVPYFATRGRAYLKDIQLHHDPKSLHSYRADAPEALHTLVTKCLLRRPESRPKAREIVKSLDDYLASHGPVLDDLCTYADRSRYFAAQCADVFGELAALVDDWYCSAGSANRVLAITGHPGDGKSYFVSWWTRKHAPESAVLVWLCNGGRSDNNRESSCNPSRFVAQLIRELSHHIPGYPGSVTFDRQFLEQQPLDALARYVTTPLNLLPPSTSQRTLVIAIDGIEAAGNLSFAHGISMTNVLQLLVEQLPAYFRLLVTCRPGDGVLANLTEAPVTITLSGEHRSLVRHASIELCNHYLETNTQFRDQVEAYTQKQSFGAPLERERLESFMQSNLASAVQLRDQNLQSTREWCEDVAAGRVSELLTATYTGDTEAKTFRSFLEGRAVKQPDAYGVLFAALCAATGPIPEELLEFAVPDWPHRYRDVTGLITVTPGVWWEHESYRELALKCQLRIRIDVYAGHEALAKACRRVLSEPGVFAANCRPYALEHYGYHLLGCRDQDSYRRWLLGEERTKAMSGNENIADAAVAKEYAFLKETKRTHFLLEHDDVLKAFIESGVRWLARTLARQIEMIPRDLTQDFIEVLTEVVANIAESNKKLLVFGAETECCMGVSPLEETDYNTFIMDPLWEHPVHVQLMRAQRRQAKKVLLIYADLYLRLTGRHAPASISDDTREVMQRNGYGPMFIDWVQADLKQQLFDPAPSLAWVHTYVDLMHKEFIFPATDDCATPSAEREAGAVDLCEDSSVNALLHMLFLMGIGWTPDSDSKSQWAICQWTELAAMPGIESKSQSSALEACGGLDAVDTFIQKFLSRARPQ